MMLKERTNRWARLKLLLAVPVMAGTLYVFAQPEVKENFGLQQVQEVSQSKTENNQDILKFLENEWKNFCESSPENAKLNYQMRTNQFHLIKIDDKERLILHDKEVAKGDLKEIVKKRIVENKRQTQQELNRTDAQVVGVQYTKDTPHSLLLEVLSIVKEAYVEVRADIAKTSGNSSKEYLDKQFPILIVSYIPREMTTPDKKNLNSNKKINGVEVKIISSNGKVEKEINNFTLAELNKEVKEFLALHGGNTDMLTVSLKVDKQCPMEDVMNIKTVLRKAYSLKIKNQS